MSNETNNRKWYHYVGPGLITACVVIGPGSILSSSKTGAANGYAMSWVVAVAVFFMSVYLCLGAKLGVVAKEGPADLVAKRAGRGLAALVGIAVFFISAAYQFGNNVGVHSAFKVFFEFEYLIVFFNAVAIAFLFGFKNLYKAVERLMMVLVGVMLVSFAVNLAFAGPELGLAFKGFVPSGFDKLDLSVLALVGTTFVVTAAYYQAYLVQQKGWGKAELQNGLVDARVSAILMGLITIMIMWTAGTVLQGQKLEGVVDVAKQLEPLFGPSGKIIFCVGLFAAAFSSFLVNSMIGGFILSDGLGLGNKPDQLWPKIFTAVVLLTGMFVALYTIKKEVQPVPAIILAQAITVLAAPLIGGVLLWLTNRKDIMGEDRNGPLLNTFAVIGFALLIGIAANVAIKKLPASIKKLKEGAGKTAPAEPGKDGAAKDAKKDSAKKDSAKKDSAKKDSAKKDATTKAGANKDAAKDQGK